MIKAIITLGKNNDDKSYFLANEIAKEYNIKYVERKKKSLDFLFNKYVCDQIILIKKDKISIKTKEEEFFFHPNMAQLRIKSILSGKKDNMIEAMALEKGMSVLDCTLGFGSDALVSAFVSQKDVYGLEKQLLPFIAIKYGLLNYKSPLLKDILDKIKCIHADNKIYLKQLDDNSFDVVYFDLMFSKPILKSNAMKPLRQLASFDVLDEELLFQAKRVAKKKVVVKENSKSSIFEKFDFTELVGGKYSHIKYGVIKNE